MFLSNKHSFLRLLLLLSLLLISTRAFSDNRGGSPFSRAFQFDDLWEQEQQKSRIKNTNWKLKLDIGLQPGTWMPKRYPGWAESGARLGFDVTIRFTGVPLPARDPGEELVGPRSETFQVEVTSNESIFVSERGEEVVRLDRIGGYSIQRPNGNRVKNVKGGTVSPDGILKFWIDCPSGAKRNDVEILPNTRMFFTTGIWDRIHPNDLKKQQQEYKEVLKQLQDIVDATRRERQEQNQQMNIVEDFTNFIKLVDTSKEFDSLKLKKEEYERKLPPPGSVVAKNGVQIAPKGSIVIKGPNSNWLLGNEYLILGTFSVLALEKGD